MSRLVDVSPMPESSGASERTVTGHVSGKRPVDPRASSHGVAVEPEQQPATFRKDVFSAALMGCETCPCAILTV